MSTPSSGKSLIAVFVVLCAVIVTRPISSFAEAPQIIYPRVMLCIDASGSMCSHYGPDRCCVAGDSTGFCSKNDPENRRIEASHRFVDSLRARLPGSEVGVATFASRVSSRLSPVVLNTDDNSSAVHAAIERAACVIPVTGSLPKTGGTTATNIGTALQSAFAELDKNYNATPSAPRHIILLTDGAWDDLVERSPEMLLNTYKTDYPDRSVPIVHAIFITDSITHVEHGYPAEGCADYDVVDRSNLQAIATLTGGMYFGGSTPETVVDAFMGLLPPVTRIEKRGGENGYRVPGVHPTISAASVNFWFNLSGREVRLYDMAGTTRAGKTATGIYLGAGVGIDSRLKPILFSAP